MVTAVCKIKFLSILTILPLNNKLFNRRTHCFNPSLSQVLKYFVERRRKLCFSRCVFLTLTLFLSPSFLQYSSSRGVTVHMVLQHCWSPVATLPTMHLWLWAFEGADRLRGLWYRPAIARCEVIWVQQWSVSKQHTPLTSSLPTIPPINPPFSIVTFAFAEQSILFCYVLFFKEKKKIFPVGLSLNFFFFYCQIDQFILILETTHSQTWNLDSRSSFSSYNNEDVPFRKKPPRPLNHI